jgi:hypothetical protein
VQTHTSPSTERLVDEFARLPVTRRVKEQIQLGAQRKVGGLWGASTGLLLASLLQSHKGSLLVLTANDVDSLQLQTDLAAFGVRSHVLPREEQGEDGSPDAATRSARQRALQLHASDQAPLLAGIEAMLQPAPTPKSLGKAQIELHAGPPGRQPAGAGCTGSAGPVTSAIVGEAWLGGSWRARATNLRSSTRRNKSPYRRG